MTIGETLARARRDAGLSIADVSNRTRIRQSIIDAIEHDDFAVCGGDFYVRGHIRAIARAVGADARPLIAEFDDTRRALEPATTAEASASARPVKAGRRQVHWIPLLGVALLAAAVLAGYLLVFRTSGQPVRHGSATAGHRPGGHDASHRAGFVQSSPSHAPRSSEHPASPPTPRSSQAARVLRPVRIAAFGPGGTRRGDSPQFAHLALAGNAATPWHSDWYTTPDFGNLQSGTGLLLDMGREVTFTAARIALGNGPGANLGLRIGNAPTLADLHTVARATGADGVVRLHPRRPARGRYLLIWFTRLPPDQAGTFQVSVYDVKLFGY